MVTRNSASSETRTPLSRERVLRAAVDLADESGIEALSMRKLGQELGVEAMSLYNHVANKEEILDGMADLIMSEIEPPLPDADWKSALRERALSAREVLVRHPWAPRLIETRTTMSPTFVRYMDSVLGMLLAGGFSIDLAHHALHALGSRVLGFTQELFAEGDGLAEDPQVAAIMLQQMTAEYPNISAMMTKISHDEADILGSGCDDQFEFEFALELMLDGLERLKDRA